MSGRAIEPGRCGLDQLAETFGVRILDNFAMLERWPIRYPMEHRLAAGLKDTLMAITRQLLFDPSHLAGWAERLLPRAGGRDGGLACNVLDVQLTTDQAGVSVRHAEQRSPFPALPVGSRMNRTISFAGAAAHGLPWPAAFPTPSSAPQTHIPHRI